MPKSDSLLIIEDTPSLSRTYAAHLADMFDTIKITETGKAALDFLHTHAPDCILLDLKLPDMDGLKLLDIWRETALDIPVIVVTANGSMGIAVDAMRRGAVDFIVKPTSRDRLKATIASALTAKLPSRSTITPKPKPAKDTLKKTDFHDFIGDSVAMQGVYKTIEAAAPSKASVFVTGETGTGKELVARAVHRTSPRASAKFVAINCGAIPKDLIESEIFGHVKGAFTGATSTRIGAAELADGGTLFLDELGEMPLDLQPKLLRFIQTGEFTRVGESKSQKTNIRFIAATNRSPLQAVRDGILREDLYYRLYVIPIELPPLRARGTDILHLARAFLERFAAEEDKRFTGFSAAAEAWLLSHSWPGNVRELENLIRQIAVLSTEAEITDLALPYRDNNLPQGPSAAPAQILEPIERVERAGPDRQALSRPSGDEIAPNTPSISDIEPLWLTEKKAIEAALRIADGNIALAAEFLQINASTIYRKRALWQKRTS